jgi:hypothetical protein
VDAWGSRPGTAQSTQSNLDRRLSRPRSAAAVPRSASAASAAPGIEKVVATLRPAKSLAPYGQYTPFGDAGEQENPKGCGWTGGRIKGMNIWPTGVRPAELAAARSPTPLTELRVLEAGARLESAIGYMNMPAKQEVDTLARSGLGARGKNWVNMMRVPVQWDRTRTRANTGKPPVGPNRSAFDMPRR